jgi:branched-chain amino acid transport system permease protein
VDLAPIREAILRGIVIGALYGLVAMGLTVIFGVMRVINVAHGEFVMLGGYAGYFLWKLAGVNPLISLFVVIPLGLLVGMGLHAMLVERIAGKPEIASLMVTFGLGISLWGLAQIAFTANFRSIQYLGYAINVFGVYLPANSALIFSGSLFITAAATLFLTRTQLGRAIRATSQNVHLAEASGIDSARIRMVGFGLGVSLAAAGGVLVAVAFVIYPQIGLSYIGKSFAVAVLGGMGSIPGALVGGFILCILENIGAQLTTPQVAQIVAWAVIFLTLIIRPSGLFGTGA